MKRLLLSLLFVIPLLAYGYTPLFNLNSNTPSDLAMKSSITASEVSQIENGVAIASNNALNETRNADANNVSEIKAESNTVPVQVALPLLAVAIGLFGFGANRRRV